MEIKYNEEQHNKLVKTIRNIEDDDRKERIVIVGILVLIFAIAYRNGFYLEYTSLILIISLVIVFLRIIEEIKKVRIENKMYFVKREKAKNIQRIIKDGKKIWKIKFETFEVERDTEEKISEEDINKEFDIIFLNKESKNNKKGKMKKDKILAIIKSIDD